MKKDFIEILLKKRKEKNLTQGEVAEKIGVSLNMYNNYERGKNIPRHEKLRLLSELFNYDLASTLYDSIIYNGHLTSSVLGKDNFIEVPVLKIENYNEYIIDKNTENLRRMVVLKNPNLETVDNSLLMVIQQIDDSIEPTINKYDKLLTKKIDLEKIKNGEFNEHRYYYFLVLNNKIVCRTLSKELLQHGILVANSDNPFDYERMEIDVNDIVSVHQVVSIVEREISRK